jgi:tetratricopeptide (TPR) repeat protein
MTPLHGKQWDWIARGLGTNISFIVADVEQSLEKLAQLLADMASKIPFPFAQWQKDLEGALYWRRAALYQEHDRDKAVYWYQEAISHIEQNDVLREEAAYLHWLIAQDFYESGEYENSLSELKEALKIKFDFADANYSRGNVYCKIGAYNRAITEYQYAIALDDHHTVCSFSVAC